MPEAIRKRYRQALRGLNSRNEREKTEAFAFLRAWRDHFSSSFPGGLPRGVPPGIDRGRFIKQRRMAIAWLAPRMRSL